MAWLVFRLWRRTQVSFDLKAAGLLASAPLITPYCFVYDFPIVVLGVVFYLRARAGESLHLAEWLAAMAVVFLPVIALYGYHAGGEFAALILLALTLRAAAHASKTSGHSCASNHTARR